jgi:hypothetical protein
MKRPVLIGVLLSALAGGGWALAQSTAKPAAPAPAAAAASHDRGAAGECPMCGQTMCGQMGGHMMGGGMGMGMGAGMIGPMGPMMMGGPGTKIAVKNVDKGVTITLTATDPAAAARLQKMAEAMRLMHEAMTP